MICLERLDGPHWRAGWRARVYQRPRATGSRFSLRLPGREIPRRRPLFRSSPAGRARRWSRLDALRKVEGMNRRHSGLTSPGRTRQCAARDAHHLPPRPGYGAASAGLYRPRSRLEWSPSFSPLPSMGMSVPPCQCSSRGRLRMKGVLVGHLDVGRYQRVDFPGRAEVAEQEGMPGGCRPDGACKPSSPGANTERRHIRARWPISSSTRGVSYEHWRARRSRFGRQAQDLPVARACPRGSMARRTRCKRVGGGKSAFFFGPEDGADTSAWRTIVMKYPGTGIQLLHLVAGVVELAQTSWGPPMISAQHAARPPRP